MRDDPLKNLAVVQAVKDFPQLYERETGIPKKEVDKLWDLVGEKVGLAGLFTHLLPNARVVSHSNPHLPITSRHGHPRPMAHHPRLLRAISPVYGV